jgi:hypothetical protein
MLSNGPAWIERWIRKEGAADITMTVQTIRNTIIASTFLGGLAFQLGAGLINQLGAENDLTLTIPQIRSVILSALLFASFVNFALTIRCCSHLGFLIGTHAGRVQFRRIDTEAGFGAPPTATVVAVGGGGAAGAGGTGLGSSSSLHGLGGGGPLLTSANVPREATLTVRQPSSAGPAGGAGIGRAMSTVLQRVAVTPAPGTADWYCNKAESLVRLLSLHFSLGLRFFYVSIPAEFFAAGPIAFLVATIAQLLFLYYVDHATS